MSKIVFLVRRPGQIIENVIVLAEGRESAKYNAHRILGGNSDAYLVIPLVNDASQTVFLLNTE